VIASALRAMVPPGVAVVAGPVADFGGALFPEETAVVARAVDKRVAEFTAGRVAARQALLQIGVVAGALPKGPGGAVVWPAGTTGSLSHGGSMVAALAVRLGPMQALGVDVEPESERVDPLADTICTACEAEAARCWTLGLLRVFSAKEAAFKALYPQAGRLFGFHALEVTLEDGAFVARVVEALGPLEAGTQVAGRQALAGGFVLSAVAL
jgi:4'-phosphopantetheinyl transferase EntD